MMCSVIGNEAANRSEQGRIAVFSAYLTKKKLIGIRSDGDGEAKFLAKRA